MTSMGFEWIGADLIKSTTPRWKLAFATQLRLELVKLRAIRQRAMPEQVDDLLVGSIAGKFVDVVAGINENSFTSKYIAQAG